MCYLNGEKFNKKYLGVLVQNYTSILTIDPIVNMILRREMLVCPASLYSLDFCSSDTSSNPTMDLLEVPEKIHSYSIPNG